MLWSWLDRSFGVCCHNALGPIALDTSCFVRAPVHCNNNPFQNRLQSLNHWTHSFKGSEDFSSTKATAIPVSSTYFVCVVNTIFLPENWIYSLSYTFIPAVSDRIPLVYVFIMIYIYIYHNHNSHIVCGMHVCGILRTILQAQNFTICGPI